MVLLAWSEIQQSATPLLLLMCNQLGNRLSWELGKCVKIINPLIAQIQTEGYVIIISFFIQIEPMPYWRWRHLKSFLSVTIIPERQVETMTQELFSFQMSALWNKEIDIGIKAELLIINFKANQWAHPEHSVAEIYAQNSCHYATNNVYSPEYSKWNPPSSLSTHFLRSFLTGKSSPKLSWNCLGTWSGLKKLRSFGRLVITSCPWELSKNQVMYL